MNARKAKRLRREARRTALELDCQLATTYSVRDHQRMVRLPDGTPAVALTKVCSVREDCLRGIYRNLKRRGL